MSITCKNKYIALIVPLFFLSYIMSIAQDSKAVCYDSTFAVSLDVSAGLTSKMNSDFQGFSNSDFTPSFRLFWKPNRKLRLGVEATYLHISKEKRDTITGEFGKTTFDASLKGLPVLLVFNMELWGIDLFYGLGIADIESTVNAFDNKSVANRWLYCFTYSIGYTYKLTNKLGIGLELKNYTFSRINTYVGGAMLRLSYDITY